VPEQTFSGLFDETANLDWVPADGLRRRARQRQRRQRFAAGAAVAAVVAVVAAGTAFAFGPGPGREPIPPATRAPSAAPSVSGTGSASPPPSAGLGSASSPTSPPPLVTDVPPAAMLAPTDVGPSGWSRKDGEDGGDWQIGFTFSICPTADQTPPDGDVDRRWQNLSGPSDRYVLQRVDAYPSAAAARAHLGWVRSNIRSCADFAREDYRISMSIVDEPAVGDEAFVVRTVGYNQQIQIRTFVRVGNLVTEFLHSDDTIDRAVALGPKAAARLCAVTRTC
jgi:hypothetical protein